MLRSDGSERRGGSEKVSELRRRTCDLVQPSTK